MAGLLLAEVMQVHQRKRTIAARLRAASVDVADGMLESEDGLVRGPQQVDHQGHERHPPPLCSSQQEPQQLTETQQLVQEHCSVCHKAEGTSGAEHGIAGDAGSGSSASEEVAVNVDEESSHFGEWMAAVSGTSRS